MIIETITSNPWFSLAGFVGTVVGIVVSVVFYRKSRRNKLPYYYIEKESIIENSTPLLPGLSVQFNGVIQQIISVAKVAFWNHGTETINGQDIAKAKPLVIVVAKGVEVLNVTVLKRTDIANQFQVAEPEKQEDGSTIIPITFDFLDQGDGALVQVVHNGKAMTNVCVEGRIKGSNAPSLQAALDSSPKILAGLLDSKLIIANFLIITIMFGSLGIKIGSIDPNARIGILIGIFLILTSVILVLLLFFLSVRKVPSAINPIDSGLPDKSKNK